LLPSASPARVSLEDGLEERYQYLGNGADKFERGRGQIVGALRATADLAQAGSLTPDFRESSLVTSRRIFIVHGHDEAAKTDLARILGDLGLEPVILHLEPDQGNTVIEKFEAYADVGFAFILLTPDDIAYPASQESHEDSERAKEARARPNVLFEYGYFVGKLGRSRVYVLHTGGVVVPTDISGVLYKPYDNSVTEIGLDIASELSAAGYEISL
jgi:predicted nucleotide-binding protein